MRSNVKHGDETRPREAANARSRDDAVPAQRPPGAERNEAVSLIGPATENRTMFAAPGPPLSLETRAWIVDSGRGSALKGVCLE